MKTFLKVFKIVAVHGLVLCLFAAPLVLQAQEWEGFVKCGKSSGPYTHECGYKDFMALLNSILQFLVVISIPIVAIGFAYAGFEYIQSGDSAAVKTKAKKHFMDISYGFLVILGAYVLVYYITTTFLKPEFILLEK